MELVMNSVGIAKMTNKQLRYVAFERSIEDDRDVLIRDRALEELSNRRNKKIEQLLGE